MIWQLNPDIQRPARQGKLNDVRIFALGAAIRSMIALGWASFIS